MIENISVIVPLRPGAKIDANLKALLRHHFSDVYIIDQGGRAKNMNVGALRAAGTTFWFLHGDTSLTEENILALTRAVKARPNAIHYFNLKFDARGPVRMNAFGANLRSRIFKLPYGDQGLAFPAHLFHDLGGYNESAPYGEDMLLVKKAKRNGIKICYVKSTLITSADRYKHQGWLKTTLMFQWRMWVLILRSLRQR